MRVPDVGAGFLKRKSSLDAVFTKAGIRSQKGKALVNLLTPGMTDLVVEKDQATPHYVLPPPGTPQLEWIASLAPIAAVLHMDVMEPMLSAHQDWINTRVYARVEEVLKKPSDDSLTAGELTQFVQDGGEMILSGVRVRAIVPWTEGFVEGGRYVVFAQATRERCRLDYRSCHRVSSQSRREWIEAPGSK